MHAKKIIPGATKNQLKTTGNKSIQLIIFNRTTMTQGEICKVKMECNNKHKIGSFFVVPGNRQALYGRPDIKTPDILTVNCSTIDTQDIDRTDKCSTNTANC